MTDSPDPQNLCSPMVDQRASDMLDVARQHIARAIDALGQLGPSREKSLAITKLEEADLWLTKAP